VAVYVEDCSRACPDWVGEVVPGNRLDPGRRYQAGRLRGYQKSGSSSRIFRIVRSASQGIEARAPSRLQQLIRQVEVVDLIFVGELGEPGATGGLMTAGEASQPPPR
jgi:hypothetical protein